MRRRTIIGSAIAAGVASASLVFGAPSVAAGDDDDGRFLRTRLTGAAEVPGPGDPDGSGTARVLLRPERGQVCYAIRVQDVEPLTAAHIHVGFADQAGPVVVELPVGATGGSGCVPLARNKVRTIVRSPNVFYVNVHNLPFPAGALRGQLG
jgi:CHRD domain